MLFRKYEDELGAALPQSWLDNVSLSFQEYFKKSEGTFQSFGHFHKDELLVIVSLIPKATDQSPISIFLSRELSDDESSVPKKFEQIKNTMTDVLGIIFRDLLQNPDNIPYSAEWVEYQYKKVKLHYKISRENVDLTLKAQELLNS